MAAHLTHTHISKPDTDGFETITTTEWFDSITEAEARVRQLKKSPSRYPTPRMEVGRSFLGKAKVISWHRNDTNWKDGE